MINKILPITLSLLVPMTASANPASWLFNVENHLEINHFIGTVDGDGLEALVSRDSAHYLVYGPYATYFGDGKRSVTFRVMISDISVSGTVGTLDIRDDTTSEILVQKDLTAADFSKANVYQNITLQFDLDGRAENEIETRLYWTDVVDMKIDSVEVAVSKCTGSEFSYTDSNGDIQRICYYVSNAVATDWSDAKSNCELSYGGVLASIPNAAADTHVTSLIDAVSTSEDFFLGINDQATEGVYIWDGGLVSTYTGWGTGEPNNFNNEDCTVYSAAHQGWNDISCNVSLRYVCSVDM